jgi:hypothetical protein
MALSNNAFGPLGTILGTGAIKEATSEKRIGKILREREFVLYE